MTNYTFLLIALLYTTFLPGFVFVESILSKFKFYIKLPLYFVFSVLISTYSVFITSFIFGFNRVNVLINFVAVLIPFIYLIYKRYKKIKLAVNSNKQLILSAILIFVLFFVPLNRGIFKLVGDNYIMSGPNWQDTAMHLSIIESLSQGNFPPVSPYFSGEKLNYYYFSDLHAAIVNVAYGSFFPHVLNLLNPFLAMTMFLSVFALTYFLTKSRWAAHLASVLSVLYGSLGFINLISDSITKKENYFNLLTNNSYHINQSSSILMVPMSDYFLQNRPMMVGLPVFIIVCLLIFISFKKKDQKILLIAGIVNALLIKFQFFGFVIGIMFYATLVFLKFILDKQKAKELIKSFVIFVIPSIVLLFVFGLNKAGDRSLFKIVLETFSLDGLHTQGLVWNLKFLINNFNLPIFIFLLTPLFLVKHKNQNFRNLFVFTLLIIVIPFVIKFTIYNYDMFKFFYYSLPLIALNFAYIISYIQQRNKLAYYLGYVVVLVSIVTSLNVLIHAYLNKSSAYSVFEYQAGLWVREKTPQKSIFLTYPSVHNGASDIGGRLRVLSYINWPHSHGFNTGSDNVFSRVDDINNFFNDPARVDLLSKYNVDYVYYGNEERSNFPESENKLESVKFLKKVYENQSVKIFEREE